MQNAMNNMEKKVSDTAWKAKKDINEGVSDVKDIAGNTDLKSFASDLTNRVSDYADKARSVSTDAFKDATGFMKRNPIGSALGLAAVGYFLGVLTARARK